MPPLKGVKPTAWHIAQPYYVDGVQECIVTTFGGNAHVDKQTPGSRRHEVTALKMFEFGKQFYCQSYTVIILFWQETCWIRHDSSIFLCVIVPTSFLQGGFNRISSQLIKYTTWKQCMMSYILKGYVFQVFLHYVS